MTQPQVPVGPDQLAPLHLDAQQRAQLREMLEYVASLHRADRIDPLRFDIDLAEVERLLAMVKRAKFEMTLLLSLADVRHLEVIVEAAGTYASRRDLSGMASVEPDDCWQLAEWLSTSASSSFLRDTRVH
jgi:hypothetical protein